MSKQKKYQEMFEAFKTELNNSGIGMSVENLSLNDRMQIGGLYSSVIDFMSAHNLAGVGVESLSNFGHEVSRISSGVSLQDIGTEQVMDLVKASGINEKYHARAAEAVGHCILKYSSENIKEEHFSVAAQNASAVGSMQSFDSMFSAHAIKGISDIGAGYEAFGQDIGKSITDSKIAIAVTLLKFHKSIMNRLIPNRPELENHILFDVENLEVYDLFRSRSADGTVRQGDHIIPFVDLYRDPSPANTENKPIIMLAANDGVPAKLLADGVPFFGTSLNMFDLSLQPGVIGYSHIDFTDLVGEGGKIGKVIFEITDGADTEYVEAVVESRPGSRFVMSSNTQSSADRVMSMETRVRFNADSLQVSGVASALLAGLSADAYIEATINVNGRVNLMTSMLNVLASNENLLKTHSGAAPGGADAAIFAGLTITARAYEPKFFFSEENVRKTSAAMRIVNRTLGYTIPGAKSVITQFSLGQARPETVINAISQLISIGNDDRGIKLILDNIDSVYDRLQQEKTFNENEYAKRVLNDFVAGHICKPAVYRDTIAVGTLVQNMRSGELWGDLRGLAEKVFLEVITRINTESYYVQALEPGEKQEFNVLTSAYILSALLAVPHYHNHLNGDQTASASDGIEYRRVLPNGTILNVITTTFDYLADAALFLPVRPNKPRDPMNYAQNIDRGTFIAQVVPNVDGALSKQVIANGREFPIITNPVAILLKFSELSAIFTDVKDLGL